MTSAKNVPDCTSRFRAIGEMDKCILNVPAGFGQFIEEVAYHKEKGEGHFLPFSGLCIDSAAKIMGGLGLACRTRNFRKHFAARIFAETGDVSKVADALNHSSKKMARAYYLTMEGEEVVDEYAVWIEAGRPFDQEE